MGGDEDDLDSEATGATVREGPGAAVAARTDEYLAEGAQVGRYVVKERLGEGGMGVVYAATDPELGRTVALKLLQARSSGGERSQAWLLREAQALARLSHPNVVAVYDVGTLSGDRVFVAMEHVEGVTLRQWCRGVRTWREVLDVMRGAGAGLAAAHEVGLVHRDFKPDNVLVGRDGRVRVMDFGLARLQLDPDAPPEPVTGPPERRSDLSIESRSPLSASLTVAGEVYGTPAYMAPELYEGTPADPRTDQFAFGVALYEALFRTRPYDRGAIAQVPRTAPLVPRTPPASHVPPRIQRVAMRALAADRDARYPSMDALLRELVADPPRTRRWAIITAALTAAGAVAVAGFVVHRSADASPPCSGIATRFSGLWDAPAKQQLRTAFLATKLPYAERASAGVERALDAYTTEWIAVATESCRATQVAKVQTTEVASLRQACLDERLDEVAALVGLFAKADGPLVDKADKATSQLSPLARCANTAALLAPDRPPPELLPKLAPIRTQLAAAKASVYAGRSEPALALADKAIEAAKELGFEPMTADALYTRGNALLQIGKWDAAATAFTDAAWAGIRGKRDDVAGQAALAAARVVSEGLGKPGEARIWLGLGVAAISRVRDRRLDLDRMEVEGIVAAASGDTTGAVTAHRAALQAAEALYGADDPALWRALFTLASTLAKSHAYTDATPHYERALALRTSGVGDDHPDIALILTSLGACYDHASQPKQARDALERALAIRERTFGTSSPRLIATLNNIADLQRRQADAPAALATITRAEAIALKTPGATHPLYHTVLTTFGEVQQAGGDMPAARATLDRALELETQSSSPMLATTLTSRAELALAERAFPEAAALAKRAITSLEVSGGAANPELWRPLAKLATAHYAMNQPALAKEAADRSLAIAAAAKLSDPELDQLRAMMR